MSQKQCEITHCTNVVTEKGKRCTHCKDRYDSNGTAFSIYCEFWKYTPAQRKINGTVIPDFTIWVHKGIIQKAPLKFHQLVGTHIIPSEFEVILPAGYLLMDIVPSLITTR